MASFLPALASFFNPANLIRGIGTTVTGVLDSISKGQGFDIAANLSKGVKTALGETNQNSPPNEGKSVIGSTTGNYAFEPTRSQYPDNQAANYNNMRIARLNTMIPAKHNATSLRPTYVDNYGRGGVYKDNALSPINGVAQLSTLPEFDNLKITQRIPTAPAGMPSFEIANVQERKGRVKEDKIVLRDKNGYKGYAKAEILKPEMKIIKKKKKNARR